MSVHAPLAPSFAPVWGHCSAAVMAATQAPNLDTEGSREGTAAHWLGAEVLLNFKGTQEGPLVCSAYLGSTAPNGVVVDEKIIEGAQTFVDDVLEVAQKHGALRRMRIEHRVKMPRIHGQNWGTLDCAIILYGADGQVVAIFLWDYKHGHRECKSADNLQLVDYAEGLREELRLNVLDTQRVEVIFRIVQPFCYRHAGTVDEWSGLLSDLRGHVNQLHAQAHAAFTNPTLTSGKHCRDCPAVGTCSGARRAGYNLIDVVQAPYEMDAMTGAELATERQILTDGLTATKARLAAIEADLEHRIGNGENGTGLALQATSGNLAWTVPPEQAAALADQFGFDIRSGAVKTPTQAKQAAPAALKQQFEQIVKTVAKRPSGKLKLTDATDSRTAKAFKRR